MAAPDEITGTPAAARPAKGHARLPHTADVCIEAWAPTAQECYEEAVAAFVGIFAAVTGASTGHPRPFHVGPGSPELLLILLLDEVLLAVDVEGLVPHTVHIEPPRQRQPRRRVHPGAGRRGHSGRIGRERRLPRRFAVRDPGRSLEVPSHRGRLTLGSAPGQARGRVAL